MRNNNRKIDSSYILAMNHKMNVIQIAECKGEKAGLSLCPKMKYEMKDYDASSKE